MDEMRFRGAILPLALAGLLAATGPSALAAAEQPKRGGVLTYAVNSDPPTDDCHATDGYSTIQSLAPHYSTLLRIDPVNYPAVAGDLAESWEVRDSGRTYVFR